jgi:hypothetical protein
VTSGEFNVQKVFLSAIHGPTLMVHKFSLTVPMRVLIPLLTGIGGVVVLVLFTMYQSQNTLAGGGRRSPTCFVPDDVELSEQHELS